MKIRGLHAENFLSFDKFYMDEINPDLNVIVGSNGSGKSNVLSIIALLMDSITTPVISPNHLDQYVNSDSDENGFEISIDIVFDLHDEKALLTDFLRSSLISESLLEELKRQFEFQLLFRDKDAMVIKSYKSYIEDALPDKHLEFLFEGTLHLRYFTGVRPSYFVYYTFDMYGTHVHLILGPFPNSVLSISVPNKSLESYSSSNLSVDFKRAIDTHTSTFRDCFINILQNGSNNDVITSDDYPLYVNLLKNILLRDPDDYFSVSISQKISNTLSHRLNVSDRDLMPRDVFRVIFENALVYLESYRSKPQKLFSNESLLNKNIQLGTGENLGLYILQLKNGDSNQFRLYEKFQNMFYRMTNNKIDVRLVSNSVVDSQSQQMYMVELIIRDENKRDVLVERSGAGLVEMAHICALLVQPKGIIVLLDEPGHNVFPAKQRRIMNELQDIQAQLFVVTHSPYLIPPNKLESIRRIYKDQGFSRVTKPYITPSNRTHHSKMIQVASRTTDVLALLFESCVILVEGESESFALPIWFVKSNSSGGRTLEEYGIRIFGVGGADAFRSHTIFLDLFRIPWVLLVDGDAKNDVSKIRQVDRIFVRGGESDKLETLPEMLEWREEAEKNVGKKSKPRQAQWIAENVDCPAEFEDLFSKAIEIAK